MVYGWQDEDVQGLDSNLFVLFSSPNDNEDVFVRGLILNKNKSQNNNYANKFEGTDADSKSPTIAGILQSGVWSNEINGLKELEGKTLITKAQTVQIFTGIEPISLDLEIEFIAQRDTFLEVENAIKQLEHWASPRLKNNSFETLKQTYDKIIKGTLVADYKEILGDIPNEVNVSFMQKRYNTTFIIESISESEEKIMLHKSGGRIRQKISLSLKSRTGITKNDLL